MKHTIFVYCHFRQYIYTRLYIYCIHFYLLFIQMYVANQIKSVCIVIDYPAVGCIK